MSSQEVQLLALGRGLEPDGMPTPHTRERAEAVYRYYDQHPVGTVVFSGGYTLLYGSPSSSSEATIMADIAVDMGLPTDKIQLEERSTTTIANIVFSSLLLEETLPVGVIAHTDQMQRAMFIAHKVLLSPNFGIQLSGNFEKRMLFQEAAELWITRALLVGVGRGELRAIQNREDKLESTASKAKFLLKKLIKY